MIENDWINSLDRFNQIWHYVSNVVLTNLEPVKQILLCQNVTSQNVSPARFLPPLSKKLHRAFFQAGYTRLIKRFSGNTFCMPSLKKAKKKKKSVSFSPFERLLPDVMSWKQSPDLDASYCLMDSLHVIDQLLQVRVEVLGVKVDADVKGA